MNRKKETAGIVKMMWTAEIQILNEDMIVAVAQSIVLKFYGKNESCNPVTVHFEWFSVQILANFEISLTVV